MEVLGVHMWKQRTSLACTCGANTTGTRFVINSEGGRPMVQQCKPFVREFRRRPVHVGRPRASRPVAGAGSN